MIRIDINVLIIDFHKYLFFFQMFQMIYKKWLGKNSTLFNHNNYFQILFNFPNAKHIR